MAVPAVLAASTSPSPAKVPPATFTVAPVRVVLSGSVSVTVGESTNEAPFSVKLAAVVPIASVGASLTAVMLMVVVGAERGLVGRVRALIMQVRVVVGL